ncbi:MULTISPECIES: DMT family transporter [unclassified Bradyrhizobium]|uniref:DMT family transporter n=1 Tax=unclassified Bradyrhizobium TaxID=2631580 RepID=UPI002915EA41|nr:MULTISPECIES: DMT family transporter [unclassified Bradyrhizobium]
MQDRMTIGDWALLVMLSVLWGGSYFFAKIIVREVPPLTIVFFRFFLGAVVLLGYIQWRRIELPHGPAVWLNFAGMGLLNNLIPGVLITWGQTAISSGLASVLVATTPIFSILLAYKIGNNRETLSKAKILGVTMGLLGVMILVGIEAPTYSERAIVAVLACLAAAISYGFANIFGQRFRRLGISPAVGAFGQIAATSVMIMPFALAMEQPWHLQIPSVRVWLAIFGLSCLSTAIGYMIFFRVLDRAGGTNISLVTLLVPASAILLSWAVLDEGLTGTQALGVACIATGLLVVDGRIPALLRWYRR